jgi:hypothetical protein
MFYRRQTTAIQQQSSFCFQQISLLPLTNIKHQFVNILSIQIHFKLLATLQQIKTDKQIENLSKKTTMTKRARKYSASFFL